MRVINQCKVKLTSTQHFNSCCFSNDAILSFEIYLLASCSIVSADCLQQNYTIEVHSLVKHVTRN
jgi:hypothetical protein